MSDSVRPHRRQPTRLPCPGDSTGKNTGVGCHFLLQCVKVKSEREVAQSCPTFKWPHRLQPTRLLHPWDFPGKSTGVGCQWDSVYSSAKWKGYLYANRRHNKNLLNQEGNEFLPCLTQDHLKAKSMNMLCKAQNILQIWIIFIKQQHLHTRSDHLMFPKTEIIVTLNGLEQVSEGQGISTHLHLGQWPSAVDRSGDYE